jgi:hypothetical protein
MKLTDRIIKLLGGYTGEDLYRKDKRHEDETVRLEREILKLSQLADGTPEGCKRGEWCAACSFGVRTETYVNHYFGVRTETAVIPYFRVPTYRCGKAEACPGFARKEKADG